MWCFANSVDAHALDLTIGQLFDGGVDARPLAADLVDRYALGDDVLKWFTLNVTSRPRPVVGSPQCACARTSVAGRA